MSPAILHVREHHFVVGIPAEGGRVVIIDPPRVPRLYELHMLADQWSGVCLLVSKSEEGIDTLLRSLGLSEAHARGSG
jgi:ABC-type bacteriocin/lantibiotic exporter with double-glycine peptidase domain